MTETGETGETESLSGRQGRIRGVAAAQLERLIQLSGDHKDELRELLKEEIERRTKESEEIKAAERRVAWGKSPERKSVIMTMWIFAALLPVFIGLGALFAVIYYSEPTRSNYDVAMAGGFFIWFFCAYFTLGVRLPAQRRAHRDRMLLEGERAELIQAEQDAASDSTDFRSLWTVTQKRLDYYHRIATTQSERSFVYGQVAAGTGFMIILVSVLVAAFAHSTAASISSAVSGISGGGLGAFIGATFMRSQDAASTQLRQYFNQPLDFSKYLAAERLLEQLDQNDRSASIQKIIEAIVTAPSPAETSTGNLSGCSCFG